MPQRTNRERGILDGMLPEILRRFDDTVLQEALRRAGVSADSCTALGGFEAHVYRLPGQILKITHTIRRSEDYLLGELDFIEHLAAKGIQLPGPVAFPSGKRIETIPDGSGGAFLAYRFEAAQGAATTYADWTDTFIETWGATAGQMVHAGMDFAPVSPSRRRQEWHQGGHLDFEASLPPASAARARALVDSLRRLPKTPETYGIIHGDLHHGNFFRSEDGRLIPFDFDDCEYGHTAREVSIPLHYALGALPAAAGRSREEFGEHFAVHFIRGFRQAHPFGAAQIRLLPELLLLRSAILMSVLSTNAFPDDREARRLALLETFRRRLAGDEPVLDIDFDRLARQLR